MNDEHSTLTFTGIHQPLYNIALDGVVYQYDGNYPQDQNPLFILWVSGTDEASTAPRQSWQWQAAPRAARSLPGLAQGFDLFRLLAINGAALWACGTVLLLRLRSGRRYRTLWTVAALLIAAIFPRAVPQSGAGR